MSAVDVKQAPATTLGRVGAEARARRKDSVWQQIWRDRLMLLFIAPGLLYFILFRYLPLLGNIIAFEDYLPFLGFLDSQFVGFANFQQMFADARVLAGHWPTRSSSRCCRSSSTSRCRSSWRCCCRA